MCFRRMANWGLLVGAVFAVTASVPAGEAVAAEVHYPLAVVADDDGPVYVADRYLPGIWKIENGTWTTVFEGSKTFRTPLNAVRCLALDADGKLLAGDSSTRDIFRLAETGTPSPLTKGEIGIPMAIVAHPDGHLTVADLEIHRLLTVDGAGGKPAEWLEVTAVRGLALDGSGRLWVVSHGGDQVLRIAADRTIEVIVKGRPFQFPHQIALDAEGNAYVSDGYAKAIWRIVPGKDPEKWVGGAPLINPVGLCWQKDRLLVADPHAQTVFAISATGELKELAPPPAKAKLNR